MRLVVFTSAVGDTDAVRPPLVVDAGVRYLCFSDRPCPAPYEWMPVDPAELPLAAARRVKVLADHPVLRSAHATLWHDASYQLTASIAWVAAGLKRADALALRHPRRGSIEAEAPMIARYGYVPLEVAYAHVHRYRADGFLDNVLTVSGLLARCVSPVTESFNRLWWDEVQQWGYRDQGSLDYAAWKAGLRIAHLDGTIKDNAYASWRQVAVPA